MKIRTLDNLQDCIDAEMAWRKRELSAIKTNVHTARSFAKETAIRSGIALLYAHWEGAVKNIASAYWEYVSYLGLPYRELKLNFLAFSMKTDILRFSATNKTSFHTQFLQSTFNSLDMKSQLPHNLAIRTGSNLNSEILVEIMSTLGLDYLQYESSFTFLDEVLLNMRNKIAHGDRIEYLSLDEIRYFEIHDKVFHLIEIFSTQVQNAAYTQSYLKDK